MRNLFNSTSRLLAGLSVAIIAASHPAGAAAESMSGKTVTIVHNASPGGATGLGAQVAADAWAKTMDGNPTIVVQSVSGGALAKGINYVMNSKPDGLTLGWVAWQGSTRILDPEELRIAFDEFGIIGGVGGANFFLHAAAGNAGGMQKPEDFMKAEGVRLGGYSAKSSSAMQSAAALDLLGISWKFASGFGGDGPLEAALLRGELDAYPATAVVYNKQLKDGPIADGDTFALFHYGALNEDETAMVPDPAFAGEVPTFDAFYEAQTGERPSGDAWEVMKFHSRVSNPVNWLVIAPPGTSDEHLAMLRTSFAQAMASDEFEAGAETVFGGQPNVVLYEDMLKIVNDVKNTPDAMKDKLRDYIAKMEQ